MVEEIKTALPPTLLTGPLGFSGFPLHFARNYYVGCTRVMRQVFTTAASSGMVIKLPLMRKVEYLINMSEFSRKARSAERGR